MHIEQITDGETIKGEIQDARLKPQKIRKAVFKDQSKIVTDEWQTNNESVGFGSRDLECFQQFRVDKAKPGVLTYPIANIDAHLPSGTVFAPYKEEQDAQLREFTRQQVGPIWM